MKDAEVLRAGIDPYSLCDFACAALVLVEMGRRSRGEKASVTW
jgi:hypothetical protein